MSDSQSTNGNIYKDLENLSSEERLALLKDIRKGLESFKGDLQKVLEGHNPD